MSSASRLIALTVAAAAIFSSGVRSQQAPAVTRTALRGATVIDVVAGTAVPDAVIVIEGDRIAAFGGRTTPIPAGATVVDLPGKFIIPGLFDSHTHYQPFLGELFLNFGVTSVMALGVRPVVGEAYWKNSQSPDVRAPRLFGTGRTNLNTLISPSMTRDEVRAGVQAWLKGEPDFANLPQFGADNRQMWAWTAEAVHDAGLFVFGHTDLAPESVRLGHDGIEHIWGFAQALMTPQELENYQKGAYLHWGLFLKDTARIDQMIREAVQRGVYLNPTMGYELGSQSTLARRHEDLMYDLFRDGALMAYYPDNLAGGSLLKFRAIRNFSVRHENLVPLSKLTPDEITAFSEAYRLSGEFIRRWVQAGGKIMGGTDDPFPGATGFNQHMEMAMLVEVGLTPMQALKAMTIWGAEVMTARRRTPTTPPIGFIGPGAFADIVVLGANPLDNIDNTRRIERVMKGGQFIRLGYSPDYVRPAAPVRAIPSTPEPEISGIAPNAVAEGSAAFEMTVEGVGFISDSVVRVDGVSVPTTFVDIRTLKARIPASVVARALPNRFNEPGPFQLNGVYGDRTVKITVFNRPPDGGTSNSVSLRVQAPWLRRDTH
ncbi:MAG: amidohydrolase family protein [Acidobacteria bacterium]|nr:amidohydrolase family protein [Acidobacteriota bacterium]